MSQSSSIGCRVRVTPISKHYCLCRLRLNCNAYILSYQIRSRSLLLLLGHVESGSHSFNDKSYSIPILTLFNLRVVCTRHWVLTTHVESRLLLHCCMVRIQFVSTTARHRAQSTIPRHTSLLTRHLFPGRLRPNFRSSAAVILVAWYSCRLLVFNQAISKRSTRTTL